MKKILTVCVIAAAVISLGAGCGQTTAVPAAPPATHVTADTIAQKLQTAGIVSARIDATDYGQKMQTAAAIGAVTQFSIQESGELIDVTAIEIKDMAQKNAVVAELDAQLADAKAADAHVEGRYIDVGDPSMVVLLFGSQNTLPRMAEIEKALQP